MTNTGRIPGELSLNNFVAHDIMCTYIQTLTYCLLIYKFHSFCDKKLLLSANKHMRWYAMFCENCGTRYEKDAVFVITAEKRKRIRLQRRYATESDRLF